MTEEWREVEGFPRYSVSDLGRVRSYATGSMRLLNLNDNGNGYTFVWLMRDGKRHKGLVHRLVAFAFLPGPAKQEVAHWNGVRSDNRASNLRWASVAENQADRKRHGTHGIRLSESDVAHIRGIYVPGEVTQQELADQFGVSQAQVGRIIRRETWCHVA